jgi:hypothetical protein
MKIPDIKGKNVLIIGCPASGKTFLSGLFKSSEHQVFHTDDYIKHGYYESMYRCLSDVLACGNLTIVEGVQGYRMLRKGIELDNYYPDVVIEIKISEQRMLKTYANERDMRKIKYLKGFNKMHDKILSDYKAMNNKNKPEWIVINNDYE